jgi:dephospho-CoA kinase
VGLTGGIASGKTTVAGMFAKLGAVILNADDEGRAVMEPGEPALAETVAYFGRGCLRADGALDRPALSDRVFNNATERRILNRITHPRIARRLRGKLLEISSRAKENRVVVVEAALLLEAGWAPLVDKIAVIATQQSTQVARLMSRSGLSLPQAHARVTAQMPLRQKLRHADYRLDGEAPLAATREQVAAIWRDLSE